MFPKYTLSIRKPTLQAKSGPPFWNEIKIIQETYINILWPYLYDKIEKVVNSMWPGLKLYFNMAGNDEEKLKVFISGYVLAKLLGLSSRTKRTEVYILLYFYFSKHFSIYQCTKSFYSVPSQKEIFLYIWVGGNSAAAPQPETGKCKSLFLKHWAQL